MASLRDWSTEVKSLSSSVLGPLPTGEGNKGRGRLAKMMYGVCVEMACELEEHRLSQGIGVLMCMSNVQACIDGTALVGTELVEEG